MGVSNIILGRPWLYDHNTILFGLPNSCFHEKSNVINPTPPNDDIKRDFSTLTKKTSDLNVIASKDLGEEMLERTIVWRIAMKSVKEHPPDFDKTSKILIQRPSSIPSRHTFQDGNRLYIPRIVPKFLVWETLVPDPPWPDLSEDFVLGLPKVQKSPPGMILCKF